MFNENTKFLVVDDFMTMRKIVKKNLADLGYKNVVEAADGKEAFDVLCSHATTPDPIQFIISDWNMPNMLGIDLLKACRADERFTKLPIMLVTAESEQKQIIEAIKSGVSEYLIKPFTGASLKEKIEKVYNKLQAPVKKAG